MRTRRADADLEQLEYARHNCPSVGLCSDARRQCILGAMAELPGRIILLNGTSSAGKTTLAHALRPALPRNFHHYASDQLADAGFRPLDVDERWKWREAFFHGFHQSIAAFASAGLDLLVEHIVEQQSWADELRPMLAPYDTFWVGVHASTDELKRREAAHGDRQPGEALNTCRPTPSANMTWK